MIEQLAKDLNVSEADLMCLLTSVCNSIKQDKAVKAYIEMSENDREEMCLAYVQHAVRKIQEFYTAYITKPELKENFDTYVYEKLRIYKADK
ncbi:hypothetical protein BOX08_gp06 [Pseudoalteromonas phage BS5]|uniref:hypothetical protein n=1 Tax=Pseudoalteromonas phage BS5 TaxID=1874539 RepID=UPI000819911C|nr:hypothetical protein BOX08_gp06 [Pseudoalteromonas phage BS5]ANY29571.1 hypothetical protein [Pseudoalteromonas phage BS5]